MVLSPSWRDALRHRSDWQHYDWPAWIQGRRNLPCSDCAMHDPRDWAGAVLLPQAALLNGALEHMSTANAEAVAIRVESAGLKTIARGTHLPEIEDSWGSFACHLACYFAADLADKTVSSDSSAPNMSACGWPEAQHSPRSHKYCRLESDSKS